MKKITILISGLVLSSSLFAQNNKNLEQMKFLGAYNAGQPGVNVYKFYDLVEDVLCYIMMPEVASKRMIENGTWVYEANTVGSISCMKTKILPAALPLKNK